MFRYEIYLPLNFNDGSPVPQVIFTAVKKELVARFHGLTILPNAGGWWRMGDKIYVDDIIISRVTCARDEDMFFRQFKRRLTEIFKQEEIWVERLETRLI